MHCSSRNESSIHGREIVPTHLRQIALEERIFHFAPHGVTLAVLPAQWASI
jgi:hypothetical protein